MKYSDYEKKIYSLTKVLRFTYLYRAVFIAATAVTAVSIVTLVTTKGIVSNDYEGFKTEYVYGEVASPSTGAFMSDASFEYCLDGNERWTDEVPTLVGTYYARAKSRNNYGSYYYGKSQKFSITKKTIKVSVVPSSITYGEDIKVSTDSLPFDDKLETYQVNIENKESASWNVTPTSVQIKNADGVDVSSCYNFVPETKKVKILKRPLSITSKDATKEYDGNPLSCNEFDIVSGSLCAGDKIIATSDSSASSIGKVVDNKLSYKIVDTNGLDMTNHYDIDKKYGKLKILERNITIASRDKNYTYNGEVQGFSTSDIEIEDGSLITGEVASYTPCDQSEFIASNVYDNDFEVKILSGSTDVTEFYNITKIVGSTTIDPRPITIRSNSSAKTYDGNSIFNSGYEIVSGSLASKDKLTVSNYTTATDAGVYENALTYSIRDKYTDENFTSSYLIEEENGSLSISKRNISLKLDKVDIVYDGLDHKNKVVVTSGTLASGDSIVPLGGTSVFHAGTYSNVDITYDIQNSSGASVLHNYNVNFDESSRVNSITISKRNLGIKILDQHKIYDGLTFAEMPEMPGYYEVTSGSLPASGTDEIYFRYLNDDKNYSETPYNVESELIIYNNHLSGSPVDVTSDYNISFTNGTFKIDKRPLTIRTIDCEYVYDRKGHIPDNIQTIQADNLDLPFGHMVSGEIVTCDEIDAGNYSYTVDWSNVRIFDGNHEDVTDNYDITFINSGQVHIKQRPVTITLIKNSKIYDGQPFSSDEYTTNGNLLEEDYPVFYGLPTVTHTPEENHYLGISPEIVPNIPTGVPPYDILMANGTVVTTNYDVNLVSENIFIEPRPITVESPSMTKTFDGLPFGESDIQVTGDIVPGETIEFINVRSESARHVADSGQNTFEVIIRNGDGVDVTLDYDITFVYGTLTINKCPITLSLLQDDVEYDGQDHAFSSASTKVTSSSSPTYISAGALPETYHLYASWESLEAMIDAGQYSIHTAFEPHISFTSDRDSDVTADDFAVSYVDCVRTIAKRAITISSMSGSKEYDGTAFPTGETISMGSLAPNHRIEYEHVDGLSAICEDADNPIGKPHIYDLSDNEVTSNYSISYKYGKVTIYEKN